MPMKAEGVASDWREIDRFDGGVGWIAHPEERMQRASHALVVDGEVWVIDPVDAEGIDDFLASLGEVAGVVVLMDRHTRDADALARRHDVPVYVSMLLDDDVVNEIDAPMETFRRDLADTGYAAYEIIDTIGWTEIALYGEETDTLVVADALGTAEYFLTAEERLGVNPVLRLKPPRKLARLDPERILVGHGAGIHEDAGDALVDALENGRRRIPRLYWQNLRLFLPF